MYNVSTVIEHFMEFVVRKMVNGQIQKIQLGIGVVIYAILVPSNLIFSSIFFKVFFRSAKF